MSDFSTLLSEISSAILNPLLALAFAFALIYFLWGVFKFVKNADNAEERSLGEKHILWGLIGMAIMIGAYTIIQLILNSVVNL